MAQDSSLPDGWVWTTVGDIVTFQYGKGLTESKRDSSGRIPVYGSNGIVGYHSIPLVEKPCLIVGRKGAAGAVHISHSPCWAIDTTYYVIPSENISLTFLYYLFSSLNFVSLDRSTAIPGLNRNDAYAVRISLPPLSEQERIVAKIEALFTQLDAGTAALKRIQAGLKRYKASVLKAACEGRLVAQDPSDEPAGALLARMGKKPLEGEGLPTLPAGWCWTKVGEITDLTSGYAFKKEEYSTSGARLLQIGNVTFRKIIWEQEAFLPLSYTKRYLNLVLKPGDLLMALNRPIIADELKIGQIRAMDLPAILYQRVGRFDFYEPNLIDYFFYYAQSPQFINKLKNVLQGVDQPFVNKPVLLEFSVPLPPLPEQKRIVAEVERQLSVVQELEQVVAANLQRAGRLRQAILKRAFEGRLVAQNPGDTPADSRLRQERLI